ncbi:sel1 repeat family protein [archaeon]|nr:MAG: sel1 repeat family protein [archaeon]
MSQESFEARMDELFYRVLGVTGVTVQQMVDDPVWQSLIQSKLQHASDLVPGQLAAMSISNGDSSPPPLSSSPAKAGGGVHEQEQQMLAALRDWILNNTSVVPKFASQYAQQLMDGGVGSVEKLAKKLTRKATYLLDLGLDEDDAEEIALAVKKGGSSATAGTTAVRAERDFGDLYRIYLQCRILGNRTKDDLVNIAMDAQDPDKARMAKALLTLAYFGGGGDFKVDMDLCHHYGNQVLSWLKENSLPPTDDLLASGDVEAAPFSTRIMATTILAYMHRDGILVGKDDIMSLRLTKAAFPYGFQLTQFLLAYAYDAGRGVVADPKKAVQYYRMAAAQNHPTALLNIGLCYVRGEGVEQDFREAIRLFKLAGEQGYSRAICEIGEIHYFGRGTAVSYESAIPFFQQAHDLGYDRASYMLGWCYLHGQGVGVDRDRGIEFLRTAVSRGNEDAQNALNSL